MRADTVQMHGYEGAPTLTDSISIPEQGQDLSIVVLRLVKPDPEHSHLGSVSTLQFNY